MIDNEINRVLQNIEELQDQNAIDFQQWKRLGQEIKRLEGKIKTSDNHLNLLMKKIKADYESLKKVIIDENVQVQLNDKIDKNKKEIDTKVNIETFNSYENSINEQLNKIVIEKVDGIYVREEIAKAQLDGASIDTTNFAYNSDIEMLKGLYENIGNYYDYTKVVSGEYWNNTNKAVKADGYFRTDYIEVKPYRKMIQKIKGELYENYGCILDKDKKLITTIKDVVGLVKLDTETIVYTLPSNAKYIIMSGFGEHEVAKKSFFLLDTLYFSSSTKPVNVENIPVNKLILNPYFDKFTNKKIIFSGDSICYGEGWRTSNTYIPPKNNTGWACLFKEEHTTANVLGYGIGGTCISKINDRTDSILERLETMDNNADYVIFEGGINDCWNNVPLGKLTDTWLFTEDEVTFDEYTFYGALESLIRKSIKKWQGAKIGFIITHYIKTGSGTQGAQVVYMNAIKKVCEKWGIPYFDGFCKIGTNACLSEINSKYFKNGDYTHPLESFYRDFYGSGIISFVENM